MNHAIKKLALISIMGISLSTSPMAWAAPGFAPEIEGAPGQSQENEEEAQQEDEAVEQPGLVIQRPDYLIGPDPNLRGNDLRESILNRTLPSVLNWAFGILGLATFIGMLIAAITLLTSYGSEEKVTRAKTNFQWGVFGFALVLLSYAIVSIIVSFALPGTT